MSTYSNQSQTQNQKPSQTHAEDTPVDDALSYKFSVGQLDEVYDKQGQVKPEWSYIMGSLDKIGFTGFEQRHTKANRILRDDGATYNLTDEHTTADRVWGLDLVPFTIGSNEWAAIETGLRERAELFNIILKDLYGERQLIKQAIVPPEAIYAHGGFLRACDSIFLPGEQQLLMHSCDMVRTSSGAMCIIGDRTQVPNGAGYALENRTVVSRVLPSLFRESHVHRLSAFFQKLRSKLMTLSNVEGTPNVVLLTTGYFNETYFEHAYLANYLGFPLVQGSDLITRNGFVWMKTLDGLVRVDVILRHVDDTFCDPVELRSDSHLGIPGLLNIARAGRVAIANPLGSGALENPVLMKYLPEISRFFLGREPRLQNVTTYWARDYKDLQHIESNFDTLIIKSIYRGTDFNALWGCELDDKQKREALQKIKAKPHMFVAQEMLEKSHVPTFTSQGLEARPTIIRSFSVAAETSYNVMPGGLTRVGNRSKERFVPMQDGKHASKSKDTWITSSEPQVNQLEPTGPGAAIAINDNNRMSLPSRVVENLFWMGRYAERAEATLRILRTSFVMINGEDHISKQCKRLLLSAVTQVSSTQPGFIDASDTLIEKPDKALLLVITDGNLFGSVRSTLNSMLYAADQSKELLSSDTMRVINDIRDASGQLGASFNNNMTSAPEEALDPLVTALMALSGLMQENMVRGAGWHFMEMGKRIERASQTIMTIKTLLTKVLHDQEQQTMLNGLLTTLEVLITYRRRYRSRIDLTLGLELVMFDPKNPRSLLFQFEELQKHILELPKSDKESVVLSPSEKAILEAITTIKLSQLDHLLTTDSEQRDNLETLLSRLDDFVCSISDVISDTYFVHQVSGKQLIDTSGGESY